MKNKLNENLSKIKTPYYLINEHKLHKNFYTLKKEFEKDWPNLIIGYSFKTNSLPWILNWMKNNGAFAEVVSEKEYNLALKVGYPPQKIIFNGPCKGFETLRYALDNNSIVNLDSFHEIEWIKNNKPFKLKKWKIGLRINFDIENHCKGETIMGNEGGRFGFNIENGSFNKALDTIKELNYVEIVGLHAHHSTKTKSLNVFKTISKKICEVAKHIDNKLEYLDIGGCFFGDKPNTPTFNEYSRTISNELLNDFNYKETKLIVEPGAAVIASPIDFVCKIIDVKKVKNKTILTTDGSCMNINPQMHDIKFQVEVVSNSEEFVEEQIIVGYTCIEKDRMDLLKNSKKLEINDTLVFKNTGAYTMSLTPLFIQYYPSVLVEKDDHLFYARKEWDIDNYLMNSYLDYEFPFEE